MAQFWKRKVLLAKVETTPGTDALPTGALNAIQAIDVKLMPMEGQDLDRGLERPFFAAEPTIPVDLHAKVSFKVELAPSGTAGTAPAWGPLLRACGLAQTIVATTSVTYNPISTGFEACTLYLNIDGILYAMTGARGTAKITLAASAIPYLEFELTGLFVQPAATTLPTQDVTAFKTPLASGKTNTPVFTLNAVSLLLRSFTLDLGVTVEGRFLIGLDQILITDRAEKVEMTIEQPLLATLNPFTLAATQTAVPLVLQHGTVAGAKVTINVPLLQLLRPGGPENRQGVVEQTLQAVPLPNAGNDQFTLVLT